MSAILTTNKAAPDDPAGTLGALLYADKARVRASEAGWVALVNAIAAGDQLALRGLYERANRIVFTLALRITGSREAAEEVTVDVFHEIWRSAATYDPQAGTVVAWIMNRTRSRAIDRVRFEQRQKRVAPPAQEGRAHDDTEASRPLELAELGMLMKQALGLLTAAERLAIETSYFGQMSYAETATRLGEPLGTVKTRIRSGLTKLRQALSHRRKQP